MAHAAESFHPVRFVTADKAFPQEPLYRLAAIVIGVVTPLQLQWIGILYASEVLLALVACWALLTRLNDGQFWRRPVPTLLAFLGVTLLAYVVSDLALETEPQNLARGWARIVFVGTNLAGLYFLSRRSPVNLVIYAIAAAAGSLSFLFVTGRFFEDWKFGASAPVTLLAACLFPMAGRRGVLPASLALAGIGLLHVALDSREIGGNCLLAGLLLFARYCSLLRLRSLSWVVLGSLALAGVGLLLYAHGVAGEEYGRRRQFSNAWRSASLITAAGAIADSPWIGNGSQTVNSALQSRYDSIFAERAGMRYRGQQTDTSTFSPHSQILQAWFEAGLFGMTFFLYLGWKLIRGLSWCVIRRPLDAFSALFTFSLLRAVWHLLFSPFAGLARLDVALAAAIVCALDGERRNAGIPFR